jgi:hypothetical protein
MFFFFLWSEYMSFSARRRRERELLLKKQEDQKRCAGVTKSGYPCKNATIAGSIFCSLHENKG